MRSTHPCRRVVFIERLSTFSGQARSGAVRHGSLGELSSTPSSRKRLVEAIAPTQVDVTMVTDTNGDLAPVMSEQAMQQWKVRVTATCV